MAFTPVYGDLWEWIPKGEKTDDKDYQYLCENPNAINYLIKNPSKINWAYLCKNKNALPFIKQNIDKLTSDCWTNLCYIEKALPFLKQNIDKLTSDCWNALAWRYDAFELIKDKYHLFNWVGWNNLAKCRHPGILPIIDANWDKMGETGSWHLLALNPIAVDYMNNNLNKLIKLYRKKNRGVLNDIFEVWCREPHAVPYLIKNFTNNNKYYNLISMLMNPNPKIIPFLHSHYTYSYLKENIYNFYPGVIYNLRYSILHCCREGIHFASLPNAVSYIEKFDINEIPEDDWEGLSYNDNALHLLNKNPEKINWENLCKATSCATDLITNNLDKLSNQDWYQLSYNLNYEDIVIKNRCDELKWNVLAEYYNKNRSDLIKQNSDKFSIRNNNYFWMYIFRNPYLLDMIKQNIYKLPYTCMMKDLHKNPGIFKLDYPAMREKCMPFAEELAAYVFNPNRISRISESYGIEFYDYMEIV